MDFSSALNKKQFFRFTGPPEHWLTTLKYWTWGLEESHKSRWAKIQTGDIFFIHSTGAQAYDRLAKEVIASGQKRIGAGAGSINS